MIRLKITRSIIGVILFCLLIVLPQHSWSAVIFEDNFDNHANWSPTQSTSGSVDCWEWNSCTTNLPNGYIGYRMARSYYSNAGHNTLNIDSTNHRGASGKAFTFWNETCTSCGWASDGLLAVKLTPYDSGYQELYVRFYIKFDSNWKWDSTASSLQKFFRITHYKGPGSYTCTFCPTGRFAPEALDLLGKGHSGIADIHLEQTYLYETSFYPQNATPSHGQNDFFYFGTGSYNGGGTDFNDSGMMGDGNWHCWEFYVKLNSAVGVADGTMKFWQDGVLIANTTDLAWGDAGSQVSPRKLWNYVMLGGNNDNKFAAQSQEAEQYYAIDDLVISTSYIDPNYVIGGGPAPDTMPPAPPQQLR